MSRLSGRGPVLGPAAWLLEPLRRNDFSELFECIDHTWARPADDVWIDRMDLVFLDGGDRVPARARLDGLYRHAELFVGEDDDVRRGGDDGLLGHLWIRRATAVACDVTRAERVIEVADEGVLGDGKQR